MSFLRTQEPSTHPAIEHEGGAPEERSAQPLQLTV